MISPAGAAEAAWRASNPPLPWGMLTPQWQTYIRRYVDELQAGLSDLAPADCADCWDWSVSMVSWHRRLDDDWQAALRRLADGVRS